MRSSYTPPQEVRSPKRQWSLISVLYDKGEDGPSVAVGTWEGEPVLAMRWNGNAQNPIGNPQSRGLPTWFIIPAEFREAILKKLKDVAPEKELRAREHFMDSTVLINTIAMPDSRLAIQAAVLEGLGKRLETENWKVRIFEPQNSPAYFIRLDGPNGFRWEQEFFGPVQQTPRFIREEIQKVTAQLTF